MRPPKFDSIAGAIARVGRERQRRQRQRFLQVGLRTALVVGAIISLTLIGVLLGGYYGADFVLARLRRNSSSFFNAPSAEALPPMVLLVAIVLGTFLGRFVFSLGRRKGFALFGVVFCGAFFAFVTAMSLEVDSLAGTPLRGVRLKQLLYVTFVVSAIVFPVSALIGWYARMLSRFRG